MNRKRFLELALPAGASLFCCARALAQAQKGGAAAAGPAQDWIADLKERTLKGAHTPAWRRADFAQEWTQRLMQEVDTVLGADAGKKLMRSCGRSCFLHSFGVRPEGKPQPGALDAFVEATGRKDPEIRREGDTVHYQYGSTHGSPYGLSPADGICLCPLVETLEGPLSATYCECSAGYVKELFERLTDRPVAVEVVESVRRGGKVCRFRIELL
jgi:hypothetical protein